MKNIVKKLVEKLLEKPLRKLARWAAEQNAAADAAREAERRNESDAGGMGVPASPGMADRPAEVTVEAAISLSTVSVLASMESMYSV